MSMTQAASAERVKVETNLRVYAMDGALLGLFMVSACLSVALIEHPSSPLRHLVASEFARRALVGFAMGVTALSLIYSPWGKRSGAVLNPAMTLAFVRLGRLPTRDALGYIVAQLAGGALGVWLCALAFPGVLSHPSVNYVVTAPGAHGVWAAWAGEFALAFSMLSVVSSVNRVSRLAPYTGCFAAALVALFITFEAPLSGMSLNPARTFASAVVAHSWQGFWIYATAPVAGALAAVELLRALDRGHERWCGKLNHARNVACFLKCNCLEPPEVSP
jgi:aquaporin Z